VEHLEFDKLIKTQLSFWQGILKLNDWDIKIDYWPHSAFENSVSKVHWSRNQQTATIALRIPEDLPPVERDWPENEAADYDISLLHELLHLKCMPLESKVDWAEEQLANHLSRAMVKLYREGHVPFTGMSGENDTKDRGPIIGQVGHYL
jgi:hypothetical protein